MTLSKEDFSDRERECLAMVAAGLSSKQIARKLQLSPRTVEMYVGNVVKRLGAHNRTQAVAMALHSQLLDWDERTMRASDVSGR
jgi:DNA-binding CsgD family transcriptional regulator